MKDIVKQQKDKMKDDIAHAFLSLSRDVVERDPGTACCVKQDYLKENSFVVSSAQLLFTCRFIHMHVDLVCSECCELWVAGCT